MSLAKLTYLSSQLINVHLFMAKRKQVFAYNEDYLKLEFTSVEINDEVRPQCVLCLKILAHGAFKEAKLRRHLESNIEKFFGKLLKCLKKRTFGKAKSH